jgi:hypothetical protein
MIGTNGPLRRLRVNPGAVWTFSSWRTHRVQQRRSGIDIGGAVINCYRQYNCGTVYELGARTYVRDMEECSSYFILILILICLCVCHRFGSYRCFCFLICNLLIKKLMVRCYSNTRRNAFAEGVCCIFTKYSVIS